MIKNKSKYILIFILLTGITTGIYKIYTNKINYNKDVLDDVYLKYKKMDSLVDYDFKNADRIINNSYSSINKINKPTDKAYLYYYKILSSIRKNTHDSILFYAEKATIYANESESEYTKAKINYIKGLYFLYRDNYPNCLEFFLKSKSYFEQTNYYNELGEVYNGLGGLYYGLNEMDKSENYYQSAYDLFNKNKNTRGKAVIKANFGLVRVALKDYKEAKVNLYSSLKTFENLKDTVSSIRILLLISKIATSEGNIRESKEILDKTQVLNHSINNKLFNSSIAFNYGYAYELEGNLDKAIECYERTYEDISNQDFFPIEALDALKRLSDILKKKERFEDALLFMNKYYEEKDRINGPNIRQNVEAIEWNTLLEKQEYDFKIDVQKQKNLNKTYIIIILSVLSSVIIIWILYKNKNKSLQISKLENMRLLEKLKANMELELLKNKQHELEMNSKNEFELLQKKQYLLDIESKNRELNLLSMQLLSKNKLFNEIEKQIVNATNNPKITFNQILKIIRQNRNSKQDWQIFEEIFQKIHPNFFKTLRDKFPDLSKTEIRICAFIKMWMSNTEISELLNINQTSLITARYKMRKKFRLSRNEDLDEYINDL
ncbi:tetratricopeptide repeat protein [Myroides indicus]|uniref:Tetratricopeptide repeat protein n=1 Tax=Myroides indicus TaxID=1323422 RepID=A0A4R7EV38_9FLAO|nr:tetratricopeptide repeat protein [Myroides indicus]TDS57872.1 tetratricopeptide repeat protein [Myroides indicus]